MDSFLGKKYQNVSSENFEEFLEVLGVPPDLRKAAAAAPPTCELTKDGDHYVLTTSSSFKTTVMRFKPGEEFVEDRSDGLKAKSVCTFEGNILKQVQTQPDGTIIDYIREFGPDSMKTLNIIPDKGVTCTKLFKALN